MVGRCKVHMNHIDRRKEQLNWNPILETTMTVKGREHISLILDQWTIE
jgi:hypothetical protein